MRNISKTLALIATLSLSLPAVAGDITVKLNYQDGSKCGGCRVSNDYNFKDVFTDDSGVAHMDVGSAERKVTVYVGGSGAACARAGESGSITVKSDAFGSISAVNGRGC